MSKTYRRMGGNAYDKKWYVSSWEYIKGYETLTRVYYPLDSKEYKKGIARYHSDAGTTNFKEPGPSWFRNLSTERPQRRFNKQELKKFLKDPNYEPMILVKDRLEYWT